MTKWRYVTDAEAWREQGFVSADYGTGYAFRADPCACLMAANFADRDLTRVDVYFYNPAGDEVGRLENMDVNDAVAFFSIPETVLEQMIGGER